MDETSKAAIEIVMAIADTIRELRYVPAGELYANVMQYLTIDQFQSIVDMLVSNGLIRNENHLLIWEGVSQ